eukprot:COSAG06_NODE_322_length_17565_cov_152.607752_10_plen_102_part_00
MYKWRKKWRFSALVLSQCGLSVAAREGVGRFRSTVEVLRVVTYGARMISGVRRATSKFVILAQVSCSPSCQPWSPKVTTAVDAVSLSSSSFSRSFPMLKSV